MGALMLSQKEQSFLEGALIPEAKFLQETYCLSSARYHFAKKYAKDKIVLDAGCSSGFGAEMLAQAGAKKVYGVDIAADAIKSGRSRYKHKNLSLRTGNLAKLNFKDNFFDLVCAFEVIEHIENYPQAIAEFHRVLKPGGTLILSTPNKAVYSPDSKKPFYPFHFHEFYSSDLVKMLKNFEKGKIYGQLIKGRRPMVRARLHPKRLARAIYAQLPFSVKIQIMRWYLGLFSWCDRKKFISPKKIKLSDVYLSDDTKKTRDFLAVCQKPQTK